MSPAVITLSFVGIFGSISVARAAEQPPSIERQTLDDFGIKTASCHEWTDECAVCLRRDDGGFVCSLPGIACQPAPIACQDAAAAAAPPKHPN